MTMTTTITMKIIIIVIIIMCEILLKNSIYIYTHNVIKCLFKMIKWNTNVEKSMFLASSNHHNKYTVRWTGVMQWKYRSKLLFSTVYLMRNMC